MRIPGVSAAIVALMRLRTPEARQLLQTCLNDREPAIRRLADRALKGDGAMALAGTLEDDDEDFRHYAARALAFYQDPGTLPALRVASKDRNSEVRLAARLAVRCLERLAAKP